MLHKISQQSMQSCSKAPWGLLVLAWSGGIFTVNARSPRPSPRQCPHDYSIRAGLNLPDKEFRYLRTIIVIAAVHRGFSLNREALPLTFRHRAGVSPYTSAFALAETCVFGKQFRGLFSCGPLIKMTIELSSKRTYCVFCLRQRNFDNLSKDTNWNFRIKVCLANPHLNERAVLIPKLRTLFCRVP